MEILLRMHHTPATEYISVQRAPFPIYKSPWMQRRALRQRCSLFREQKQDSKAKKKYLTAKGGHFI